MTLGLPVDASRDGHRVDELLHFAHVSLAVLLSVVVIVVVLATLRGRDATPASWDGDSWRARAGVLTVALLTFLAVDGGLFFGTLHDLRLGLAGLATTRQSAAPDARTLRIEVNAQRWAWAIRYPGPDGAFDTADDVLTWNELEVPLGVPVQLQLGSVDVIHDFSLPNFRIKTDVIPGRLTELAFVPERLGEYEVLCSQFCGLNHYKMRAVLKVVTPAEYEAWASEASAVSSRGFDAADVKAHWGWAWEALE